MLDVMSRPISEFVAIYAVMKGDKAGGYRSPPHIVHKDEADAMVAAIKALHIFDGQVNPITGTEPAKLEALYVCPFENQGQYWWSTPSLKVDDNYLPIGAKGAEIIAPKSQFWPTCVYESPELIARNKQAREDEDRAEAAWDA